MHDTPTEGLIGSLGYISGIILFLLLFVAFYFASERNIKMHRLVIRIMYFYQIAFIVWMIFSLLFTNYGKNYALHAFFGSIAFALITYTFLLMEGKIPKDFQIPRRYRRLLMQITFVVWGLALLDGSYLYLTVCC